MTLVMCIAGKGLNKLMYMFMRVLRFPFPHKGVSLIRGTFGKGQDIFNQNGKEPLTEMIGARSFLGELRSKLSKKFIATNYKRNQSLAIYI